MSISVSLGNSIIVIDPIRETTHRYTSLDDMWMKDDDSFLLVS